MFTVKLIGANYVAQVYTISATCTTFKAFWYLTVKITLKHIYYC